MKLQEELSYRIDEILEEIEFNIYQGDPNRWEQDKEILRKILTPHTQAITKLFLESLPDIERIINKNTTIKNDDGYNIEINSKDIAKAITDQITKRWI